MTASGGVAQAGEPSRGGTGGGAGSSNGKGGTANAGSGQGGATGGSSQAGSAGKGQAGATACATEDETKFSFFLISHRALQRESGSIDGFGGDFGGITGADAICQRVAEYASACQKTKVWRAFLSTTTVNAADRIGSGPWYDRRGRLLATNLTNLLKDRPMGADPAIANDFPNEDGIPNHNPDGTGNVDNHQILTGTGIDGKIYTQSTMAGSKGGATSCGGEKSWSPEAATCWDWTSKEPKGCPRAGHSWPSQLSGVNWISVWNEGGCAPGGNFNAGGLDGTRKVGSAGGYGGYYCFALTPSP
jgi:hypothetical protein